MKCLNIVAFIVLVTVCACNNNQSADKHAASTGGFDSTYRPSFHFTAKANWINDPNGLVYYKDNYHLFFQYNPFGDQWGHMSWGHATTKDLIKWEEQPVAIAEYANSNKDTIMVFSGTAVVDSFNSAGFGSSASGMPLVAIYTSNVVNGVQLAQNQSMAHSLDGNTFKVYDKNPVLDIQSKEFRDPKVFWHTASKKWVMIVVKSVDHLVQFYGSANLKKWSLLSEFGKIGDTARVWECPDIFELPVTNEPGKSKWVVTLSAGHPQKTYLAMQYFTGSFDGKKFTADTLNYPFYLDQGKDFYAGITYNNLPPTDKRTIMIGWANSWEYAKNLPLRVFRGMMAIPRSLSLIKTTRGYTLVQQPVEELNSYLGDVLFQQEVLEINNTVNSLTKVTGAALDIQFTLSKTDAAKAGLKLFKNGEQQTPVYFDKAEKAIKLDRTHSGNISFSKRFPSIEWVNIDEEENIQFRILVDKSLVEVFVNDGRYTLTDQVYPTANGHVEFFAENGGATFTNVIIRAIRPSMHVK
ncbi:MAG: glycoside hydrolase family 32 protein [Ferruginibacter sp.]|nr:glycoside hydrolase family 32 protein [Ferruginibacter sp.]